DGPQSRCVAFVLLRRSGGALDRGLLVHGDRQPPAPRGSHRSDAPRKSTPTGGAAGGSAVLRAGRRTTLRDSHRMPRLLHIQTSPRGGRSASQAVAEHFIDSYRNTHRGDTVETLNVWQAQFPELDGAIIDAKYAIVHGQPHSPDQVHAWKAVARIADHFKSADKYVVSLPMWNFGIPYKLKHYIDLLVQPGLTFGFTPGE